jgi:hypothetical protein
MYFTRPQSAAVRTKAVEVLSFISGVCKARPQLAMPLGALLELHVANVTSQTTDAPMPDSTDAGAFASTAAIQPSNPFLDNFTVLFLDLAFTRLPPAERYTFAPRVLHGLSARSVNLQTSLLHTFLFCLPHIVFDGTICLGY